MDLEEFLRVLPGVPFVMKKVFAVDSQVKTDCTVQLCNPFYV